MTTPTQTQHRMVAVPKKRPTSSHRPTKPASSSLKVPKPQKSVDSHGSFHNGSEDDEDPVTSTFLQFCAHCDSQIIVPNQSILYCSESCRRKDTVHSPHYSLQQYDVSPVFEDLSPDFMSSPTTDPFTVRNILPQRSPTLASHQHPVFLNLPEEALPEDNSKSAEPDPRRPSTRRTESEAAKYLRQFQTGQASRPRSGRFNTSVPPPVSTPSLSHTPASSIDTSASYNFPALSSPYRPLPPRGGNMSFATRSVDLVTPIVSFHAPASWTSSGRAFYSDHSMLATSLKSYPAPTHASESHVESITESYKKRHSMPAAHRSPGQSSLMQLFKFEEMRAGPNP